MSPISKPKKLFAPHSLREILFKILSPLMTIVQMLLIILLAPTIIVLQVIFFVVAVVYVFFRSQLAWVESRLRRKFNIKEDEGCGGCGNCKKCLDAEVVDLLNVPKFITTDELFERMQKEDFRK